VLLCVLAWGRGAAGAQEPVPAADAPSMQVLIRAMDYGDWPEVSVVAVAEDGDGAPVTGLTAEDFALQENDRPVAVQSCIPLPDVGHARRPVLFVTLVTDNSISMARASEAMRKAAYALVKSVTSAQRMNVVGFFESKHKWGVAAFCDFTADTQKLAGVLSKPRPATKVTLIWDAVYRAIDGLTHVEGPGQKVVVVLSDGQDNGSKHAWRECAERAAEEGVTVYCMNFARLSAERSARAPLALLAARTGGKAWLCEETVPVDDLQAEIGKRLGQVYVLSFRSLDLPPEKETRSVALTVCGKGGAAHAERMVVVPRAALLYRWAQFLARDDAPAAAKRAVVALSEAVSLRAGGNAEGIPDAETLNAALERARARYEAVLEKLLERARALAADGKHAEAIAAYAAVLDLEPQDDEARRARAQCGARLGGRLRTEKRYEQALAAYQQALADDPDCASACAGLVDCRLEWGEALLLEDRPAQANEQFRHALESGFDAQRVRESIVKAYVSAARRLAQQHSFDAALARLAEAAEIDPDSPLPASATMEVRYARAQWLHEQGSLKEAVAEFQAVLKLDAARDRYPQLPDEVRALQAAICESEGDRFYAGARYAAAIASYTRAAELAPDNTGLSRKLANAHTEDGNRHVLAGDLTAGAQCYRLALQCEPDLTSALYGLATVSYQLMDFAAARENFERARLNAAGLPPGVDVQTVEAQLGMSELALGDFDGALALFRQGAASWSSSGRAVRCYVATLIGRQYSIGARCMGIHASALAESSGAERLQQCANEAVKAPNILACYYLGADGAVVAAAAEGGQAPQPSPLQRSAAALGRDVILTDGPDPASAAFLVSAPWPSEGARRGTVQVLFEPSLPDSDSRLLTEAEASPAQERAWQELAFAACDHALAQDLRMLAFMLPDILERTGDESCRRILRLLQEDGEVLYAVLDNERTVMAEGFQVRRSGLTDDVSRRARRADALMRQDQMFHVPGSEGVWVTDIAYPVLTDRLKWLGVLRVGLRNPTLGRRGE